MGNTAFPAYHAYTARLTHTASFDYDRFSADQLKRRATWTSPRLHWNKPYYKFGSKKKEKKEKKKRRERGTTYPS